jgi:hypothetical protein
LLARVVQLRLGDQAAAGQQLSLQKLKCWGLAC